MKSPRDHSRPFGNRGLFDSKELTRLLNPRSVAIIGASTTPGSFGLRTLENIGKRFDGRVFPVNPRYKEIQGLRCYAGIEDLPEVPDCAIITVPGSQVEDIVKNCATLGVGGCILYSAGYAEVGTSDGIEAQNRLTDIAQNSGMRILGPNCLGIVNCITSAGLTFMPKFYETPIVPGRIGLISQSGGLGYVVLQAMERGIGFSSFLSAGNCCDVDVSDLISYLVDDKNTNVIACMLEGISDGRRFLAAGQRALEAGKPLLIYKMGNSQLSKRTALSHTGTIAGSNTAYKAAFERTGMVRIDNWEELLETARFFSISSRPKARGVGIMANSGGAAVMGADKADEYGIDLPQPEAATKARLAQVIPAFGSCANPSDLTAESLKSNDMFETCIRAFDEDPGYGAVVVPMMSAHRPATVDRAKYIADLVPSLTKPTSIVWLNEWYQGPGSEEYDRCPSLAVFRSMGRCLKAIRLWLDYYDLRDTLLADKTEPQTNGSADMVRHMLRNSGFGNMLSEAKSKEILAAYGIPITRHRIASSAQDAVKAAYDIGYPVALKAESADIPHKTDAGVVRLNLQCEQEVLSAYAEIINATNRLSHKPELDGVSVQEMIPAGVEMLIGATQDAQFGPMITCGFGGIAVEIIQDIVTSLAPVNLAQAERMIKTLKSFPLLNGYRNLPVSDLKAFADTVVKISHIISDLEDDIEEIDVNPVFLHEKGLVAIDALIVRRQPLPQA